jgi:hypothetical protein
MSLGQGFKKPACKFQLPRLPRSGRRSKGGYNDLLVDLEASLAPAKAELNI